MKRIKIITVILAWSAIATGSAQEKGSSELSLGYGRPTSNEIENTLGEVLTTIVSLGTVTYTDTEYTGAVHAKYKYAVADNLLIGVSGAYEEVEDKERFGADIVAERKSKIYSIAVESDYSWINKGYFRVCSGVGLGYRMVDVKSISTTASANSKLSGERAHGLGYHINAIGIRAGKTIGVFAEAGYGYKGIVNAGLSIQF